MSRQAFRFAPRWLLALAALVGAALLAAQPAAAAPADGRCFADGTRAEAFASLAAAPARWVCGQPSHSIAAERVFVRFAIPAGAEPPRYLETRRAALKAVHILVTAADGTTRSADFAPDQLQPSLRGGYVRAPLPLADAPLRQVLVAFDEPTHKMTLEQAQLVSADAHDGLGARPRSARRSCSRTSART